MQCNTSDVIILLPPSGQQMWSLRGIKKASIKTYWQREDLGTDVWDSFNEIWSTLTFLTPFVLILWRVKKRKKALWGQIITKSNVSLVGQRWHARQTKPRGHYSWDVSKGRVWVTRSSAISFSPPPLASWVKCKWVYLFNRHSWRDLDFGQNRIAPSGEHTRWVVNQLS